MSAFPICKDRFVVEKTVDNSIHAALVDENENFLVPFFRGVICQTGVLAPEGTPPILVIEPSDGKVRFVNTDGLSLTVRPSISMTASSSAVKIPRRGKRFTFTIITARRSACLTTAIMPS